MLIMLNSCFPCLNELKISFEHLQNVTENFTNHIARVNCAKFKCLLLAETIVHSNEWHYPECSQLRTCISISSEKKCRYKVY